MNLSLGFPEFSQEQSLTRRPGLDAAIHEYEALARDPHSPIRAVRVQPARSGEFVDLPACLDPRLREGLERRGIKQLYTHQGDAFDRITSGRNVVVVTPTASGKTLCYNLPVLNRLLAEPSGRAMYLFPTKALAEDQLQEFNGSVNAMGSEIRAFTFDGDTPTDARKAIRERANVVMTNPDMLHSGILPHHTKWAKCFENLRYFVIDELHYYRGVYGSHLANVIRRLKRICEFYGSQPQFICCSATIANPRELAEAVCEVPFELVDRNGAPSGEKYFVFYNPPVVNRQLGIRRSYLHEARKVALDFIDHGHQTLVFCNHRLATEVLVTYLKEACERKPMSASAVRGYRAGYLPKERREIECQLRKGDVRCVVATNALELGIDIGSLDAVVMAGYPGTVASTLQRAGRAGRRQSTSLCVMVASSDPLDQYIVEHPDYFFSRAPEEAHINADNLEISLQHLKCAAFELPIRDGETYGPHNTRPLCEFLQEQGFLHPSAGVWHWTSDTYPADAVSLRAITSDNFVIVDVTRDAKVIGELPFPTALIALHEKAIYLHEAKQFQVEKFDYDGRKAYVRQIDCDYYTQAIDYTQVKPLQEFEAKPVQTAIAVHGEVRVNRQIVGWKKIRFFTMENVGAGHLSLPEQEMHTTAWWLHFPEAFLSNFPDLSPSERQAGILGLGNALRSIAALLLMTDPRDIGMAVTEDIDKGVRIFEPNLYLYDNYPGGVGQSAPLFRLTPKLLSHTAALIAGCRCEEGCPSCVGPMGAVGARGKEAAQRIVAKLIEGSAAVASV